MNNYNHVDIIIYLETGTHEDVGIELLQVLKPFELRDLSYVMKIPVKGLNRQQMINKIIRSTITANNRRRGIRRMGEAL